MSVPSKVSSQGDEHENDESEYNHMAAMMDEQRNLQAIHEQRITQVEQKITQVDSRVTVVEVGQRRLETALEKLTDIMAVQATKTTLTESAIDALKKGQEQHHTHLEEMKRESVDVGKVLEQMKSQMNVLKAIGMAFVSAVVSVLVAHYLHLT